MSTTVNTNSQIYYNGTYWNDYPQVLAYMCQNFSGDPARWWVQDFKDRHAQTPFERGLFLNCGNGWVERDFIDKNIVRHAVGFDYAHDLLRIANREKGSRRIDYFQTDVNRVDFAGGQFDLVVNVAAMHHVQYINRLCRILCETLQPDGMFVHFDYIGPRRNQYSVLHWLAMQVVNRQLPERVRKAPFVRPHLPTMLATDPTEAIHSDLTIRSVGDYFDIFERHDTGGGVAYEIMTHNTSMQAVPPDELAPHITRLLELDRSLTRWKIVPPMFSYFIARPLPAALQNRERLDTLQQAENRREARAARMQGVYSPGEYMRLTLLAYPRQTLGTFPVLIKKVIRSLLRRADLLVHKLFFKS